MRSAIEATIIDDTEHRFLRGAQSREALRIITSLRDAGFVAYLAGGCVRDQLLGLEPKDYDVATSARPDQVREVFGQRRTLAIGAAFGVISVLGARGQTPIEVATFRGLQEEGNEAGTLKVL